MKRWLALLLVLAVVGWALWNRPPSGNVAVVVVEGVLLEPDPILREFEDLRKNEKVKAVILRIDSPGGSVGAAQEIHDGVRRLAKTKQVVASFANVAASGGYYVALPAHRIVANAGTVTGSIGVRMEYLNVEDLLRWARLRPETLKSGRWKDVGSSTRPMTAEEREYLETVLKQMHRQFKAAVAEGRHLKLEVVDGLAEGQIFTGEEAKAKGLVDELGNLDRAIQVAGELAGLKEEPEVFYPEKEYDSFLERLLGEASSKVAAAALSRLIPGAYFVYEGGVHD